MRLDLRIDERTLRAHDVRMRRIALVLLPACGIVPVAATAVAVELSFVAIGALVGLIIGVDMLVRARRGLAARGDLSATFEGREVTWGREGSGAAFRGGRAISRESGTVSSAQAFPDHVQLVIGAYPRVRQLELPVTGDERARLLAHLREHGVAAGERAPVALRLATVLTLGPAIAMAAVFAWRAVVLATVVGIAVTLRATGVVAGLVVVALGAAIAVWVQVRRR
jgi:hypothetical protein